MPRTAIAPQQVTSSGITPVPEPANVDGHAIPLGAGYVLVVDNASAASVDVTVPTTFSVDGLDLPERTIPIPAGEARHVALGGQTVYRQADGSAWINFPLGSVASVTVYLLRA